MASSYVFDDTFTVLDELKGKYQLVLLTNGSPSLQRTKLELTPKLNNYFDSIIISGDFGVGKPNASIFHHALESIEVKKEEAIMVGDNLSTDILGAHYTGMKSAWINRHQTESNEIKPSFEFTKLTEILPIINH